jgi:rubredoxin
MAVHARLVIFAYGGVSRVGCVALMTGVSAGPRRLSQWYRAYQDSRQTCPDCAPTVPAIAHKCRYCGYRFSPLDPRPGRTER